MHRKSVMDARVRNQNLPVFFTKHEILLSGVECIRLSPEESIHVARSRRLGAGSRLLLNSGMGKCAEAEIVSIERKHVHLKILKHFTLDNDLLPLDVVCSVIKGDRMNWLIAKLAELGVSRIFPVHTEHTVVSHNGERASRRVARWQTLCREALKQCRGNFMTSIMPPCTLEECIDKLPADHCVFVMWEGNEASSLMAAMQGHAFNWPVSLIIGPEGGFSNAETALFRQRGFPVVSLGSRILRSETAAIAAVSAFMPMADSLAKTHQVRWAGKKPQMQEAQISRNEAQLCTPQ